MNSFDICKKCDVIKKNFKFNNLFHIHIRECIHEFKSIIETSQMKFSILFVIKFSVSSIVKNNLSFRNYRFATMWIFLALKKSVEIVTDTKCAMLLIDEFYFLKILSNEKFTKITTLINICEINNVYQKCDFYTFFDIYFDEISKNIVAREYFRKKVHVVKNFKCKIFFEINIFETKRVILNLTNKVMIIFTCKNLIVFIKIILKLNARIWRVIHFKNQSVISIKSMIQILIYMKKKTFFWKQKLYFRLKSRTVNIISEKIRWIIRSYLSWQHELRSNKK